MQKHERWRGLFSHPERLERWQAFARRTEQKVGAFLQFDAGLAAGDSAPLRGFHPGRQPAAADGPPAGEGSPLAGVPFGVKDLIAVRPFRLTCGSRLLKDFVAPYTATSVARLQAQGAVAVGKTNLDEFGMGSSTENSALGRTNNPWDLARVAGGSSGGSAAAVAAGIVPFALGSDTGGSVRQPAAFCGVYGLKPTYGAVSRFGLTAYASSLDVIGVASKTVAWAREAFEAMRGIDPLDHSSAEYRPFHRARCGPLRVGVLSAGKTDIPLDPSVERCWERTLRDLPKLGFALQPVEIPSLDYVVSAYYVIACAEASANLARFDGIRYGSRAAEAENPEELVRLSRSQGLGEEVKLRILLGTYVLRSGFQDQYYLRAQRIRTRIRQDFDRVFSEVDLVLLPVFPCPAFRRGDPGMDPFTQKLSDIFTCSANLAGLPAMSFPAGVEGGLPVGLQFMAPAFAEQLLFEACSTFEKHFPSPDSPLYDAEWKG
jgi:aspartyl-tRNA(Asn)/glutamyl-tRNA(Gln) amidotransferase subunit A